MIVVVALPSCKLTHKHAILVINVYYNLQLIAARSQSTDQQPATMSSKGERSLSIEDTYEVCSCSL